MIEIGEIDYLEKWIFTAIRFLQCSRGRRRLREVYYTRVKGHSYLFLSDELKVLTRY